MRIDHETCRVNVSIYLAKIEFPFSLIFHPPILFYCKILIVDKLYPSPSIICPSFWHNSIPYRNAILSFFKTHEVGRDRMMEVSPCN